MNLVTKLSAVLLFLRYLGGFIRYGEALVTHAKQVSADRKITLAEAHAALDTYWPTDPRTGEPKEIPVPRLF